MEVEDYYHDKIQFTINENLRKEELIMACKGKGSRSGSKKGSKKDKGGCKSK